MGEPLAARMRTTISSAPSADPDAPSDGFDVEAFFAALGRLLERIAPAATHFDPQAIAALVEALRRGDARAAFAAAARVATDAARLASQIPGAGDALRPVVSAIEAVDSFSGGEGGALLDSLRRAASGDPSVRAPAGVFEGLALAADITAGPAGRALHGALSLVVPAGARAFDLVASTMSDAAAARIACEAAAGLAAIHTCAAGFAHAARRTPPPDPAAMRAGAEAARAAIADGLAARISSVLPGDAVRVATVGAEVDAYLAAVGAAVDDPRKAILGAEGVLRHFDAATIAGQLEQARALATRADLAAVRRAALGLRQKLERPLSFDVGAAAASPAEFATWLDGFARDAATRIDAIDLSGPLAPITQAIDGSAQVAGTLANAIETALTSARAAFESVRNAVRSIDLGPIVTELRRVLEPMVQALATIGQLVAQAQQALRDVATRTTQTIDEVIRAVQSAVGVATDAFRSVLTFVEDLRIDAVVDTLRQGTDRVAAELRKCQLQPYFDTAVQVIDTTATVVDAIPFDLLPEEQRRKLPELTRPIKEIDFQGDVADPLKTQLDEILDTVDEQVLRDVQQAFEDASRFLREEIDPRRHLTTFEREQFDPALERITSFDPDEALKPVTDALEQARDVVRALDLGAALRPVEEAFDRLLRGFDELDPGALAGPYLSRVTQARDRLRELIALDRWAARLDDTVRTIQDALGALTPERLLRGTAQVLRRLVDVLRGPGGIAMALGPAVFSAVAGTGLPARTPSLTVAIRWIRGDDGAAAVRELMRDAATRLAATRDAIRAISIDGAPLEAGWTAVRDAVLGLAADHPLRTRVERGLGRAPTEIAALYTVHRDRVLGRFDAAHQLVSTLAGSGFSEVTAVSEGLREALRPLSIVGQKLGALIERAGIRVGGRDAQVVIDDLIAMLEGTLSADAARTLLDALRNKAAQILSDVLVAPAHRAIAEVTRLLDSIDPSVIERELSATHALIRAEIQELRPTRVLSDLIAAIDSLRNTVLGFDPLGPVRDVLTGFQQAVQRLGDTLRPTALFADLLAVFDELVELLSRLDVSQLLRPILDELRAIEGQLDTGLDGAATALGRLQQSLP